MKKSNEDLQKVYLEFQILSQQMNQLQQQINSITTNIFELKNLEKSLDEIQKVKKDNKILIPLGSNIFIKGKLEESKEVIMGVGSKALVKKDLSYAKTMVNKQTMELEAINSQMQQEIKNITPQLENLQKELSKKEEE